MKNQYHMRILSLSLFLPLFVLSLSAQDQKALSLDDYKQWNQVTNTTISPNGQWMTYTYLPNEGDTATFAVRKIEGEAIYSTWNAKRANFSADSKWLAFLVDPMETAAKALKKQKKPVTSSLHLYNLASQTVDTIKDVQAYQFSEASNFIAIQKTKSDPDAEHAGTDLIIKDLNGGAILNIGNVSAYDFNETGEFLAYLVDANGDSGNGTYVKDLDNHRTWALHTGMHTYSQLSWNEAGDQLAVLFGTVPKDKTQRKNTLLWVTELKAGMDALAAVQTFVPSEANDFPKDHVISEYASLKWNEKSSQLFFGIKAQEAELKEEEEQEANVDVWHWKDEVVQSRQMVTANQDRKATYLSVLNLSSQRFVQLETKDMSRLASNEKTP